MTTDRPVAFDCRYFLGDRPCVWHKRTGVVCECEHYERVTGRVLIIKLDAMGDVLRTTCLLPANSSHLSGTAAPRLSSLIQPALGSSLFQEPVG